MSCLIHHPLDEIANRREVIVDDVAGPQAVGGNKDVRVESCTKQVDGDHWSAAQAPLGIQRLAQQQLASLQRGMRMAGDCMANDLSEDHGGRVMGYGLSYNPQIFDEYAAADASERFGSGDAFAGGGGDRVGEISFPTQTEASHRRTVFHK